MVDKRARAVVTLYATPEVDPTYATVLFRVRTPLGDFLNIELSPADAQRLGHKLNNAGGGVLDADA